MARTWTLEDNQTLSSGEQVTKTYLLTSNTAETLVYFSTNNGSNEHTVYSWDGTTFTDISGTTFDGSDFDIIGMCFFSSNLYVLATYNASNELRVYRHTTGTTWVVDATLLDSSGSAATIPDSTSDYGALGCDGSRMVARINRNDLANNELKMSTNGTSWSTQDVGSSTVWRGATIYGLHNRSLYGELLVYHRSGATRKVASFSAVNTWAFVSANNHNPYTFAGYSDEHSEQFFAELGGDTYESSDWGGSTTSALTSECIYVYDFGNDATLTHRKYANPSSDLQVYKYDGADFIADGTCGSDGGIFGFTKLGTDMIAAIWDDSNEEIRMYSSPAPSDPESRILGIDADSQTLYVTKNDNGTLKTCYYNIETAMTEATATTHGAATFAEIDNYTRALKPRAKPAVDGVVYLYGRDGSNVQVQYNDRNGTLGWQDVGAGTATWATSKVAVALTPDILAPANVTVAFYDGEMYRSFTGTSIWTSPGSAGGNLINGQRYRTSNAEHLVAGTAEGTIEYTPNYGNTFSDVSGTALGTVNWFEESI